MKSETLSSWLIKLFVAATLVVVAVLIFYLFSFGGNLSDSHERWGQFGDFVGGTLNPILSFFALGAILLTIVLQSRELELTREELRRSAAAQEASEIVLIKQSEILSRQQFEATFFSLLGQHNGALNRLISTKQERQGGGSDLDVIKSDILTASDLRSSKYLLEEKNSICGHYFMVLYQVLKFIYTNVPGGGVNFAQKKY